MEKNHNWYIWSIEHDGWWRPNETGYTRLLEEAGHYTFKDACRIVHEANMFALRNGNTPKEAMIQI